MAKQAATRRKKQPPITTVHDVPDLILRRIFLLLDTHITVIRAAAVCARWRALASTRGVFLDGSRDEFFRRHPGPHVLGHYHVADPSYLPAQKKQQQYEPAVFVPAASPPSVNARHFSLDFLPPGPRGWRPWRLLDSGGSLLLLGSSVTNQRRNLFPELVVCDPITRRYVKIEPMEGMKYCTCLGVLLGTSRFDSYVSMSAFVVTCVVYERSDGTAEDVGAARTCTYTHHSPRSNWVRNGWSSGSTSRWELRGAASVQSAGRAAGKMFWTSKDGAVLAATNAGSTFWHIHLPDHARGSPQDMSKLRFVDSGAAAEYQNPPVARLATVVGDELRVSRWNLLFGPHEWELERSVRLPEATRGLQGFKEGYFARGAKIVTARRGYVVLTPAEETWLFSVDLRTMQAERDHPQNRLAGEVYPYELTMPPQVRAVCVTCKNRHYGACHHICKCSQVRST